MSSPTITSPPTPRSYLLGPLTTTFTPPQECSYLAAYGVGSSDVYIPGLDQGCSSSIPGDTTTCWPAILPSAWSSILQYLSATSTIFNGLGFYSPGLQCPLGYASACVTATPFSDLSSSYAGNNDFSFQYALESGETAIGCCPSGFSCTTWGSTLQSCISIATDTASTFEVGLCGQSGYTRVYAASMPGNITFQDIESTTEALSTTNFTSFSVWAPLIQMNFQATDISTSTSDTIISPTTIPPSDLSPTSLSPSSTTSAPPAPDDGGLSIGAKLALGLALPLGLIAIAFIAGCVLVRRRRNQRVEYHEQSQYDGGGEGRGIYPTTFSIEAEPVRAAQELHTPDMREKSRSAELSST